MYALPNVNRLWLAVQICALATLAACPSNTGTPSDGEGGEGGGDNGDPANEGGQGQEGGQGGEAGAEGEAGAGGGKAGSGGTTPQGGTSGASVQGGAGGTPLPAGKLAWCNDPKLRIGATDGVHTTEQIKESKEATDPARLGAPAGFQGAVNPAGSTSTHWKNIYVPKQYETAEQGTVAVWVSMDSPSISGTVRSQLEYLTHKGEIPPVILLETSFSNNLNRITTMLLPEVLAKFPKISSDPTMHVISGGSTRGAEAFDLAWDKPDLFGLVFTGSGSFVCFRPNYPYDFLLKTSPKKNLRVSMAVGTCDIWGKDDRWPAECGTNCGKPLCFDASSCAANWVDANKVMAAALTETGHPNQLFLVTKGRHNEASAVANFGDAVRWLFKPRMCR